MFSFGRVAASFIAMMVLGYIAVVVMLPRPADNGWRQDDGGQIAASRLSEQAQALLTRRSATVLQ